ncbi:MULTISPECIES: M56 family metallopeptidase [Mycobacteriaceae]|uniref:M56 family metallopeptidase n=1 Tax=Mycobacteriaceae TaxID=1762 RepID=UPI001CD934F8|nr:M56 family metallopeptidase [Mycobacterium sp. WUMAC-067]
MTSALWWAVMGVALGVGTPPVLRLMTRRGSDAAIVLAVWGFAVLTTTAAIAFPAFAQLLHLCGLTSPARGLGKWDVIAATFSGGALVVAVACGGWRWAGTVRQRRRLHDRHVQLSWLLTGRRPHRSATLWLPVGEPLAYSLSGRPALVVMSMGLRHCLDPAAVEAVQAHERAHVRRRHHLLTGMAHAAAAGLGWLPLMRQSPALVATLVELDADACVARVHGRHGLRRALQTLQASPAPAEALGMGALSTDVRMARLSAPISARPNGFAVALAAGCTRLLAGGVVMLGVLILWGLVSCPTGLGLP